MNKRQKIVQEAFLDNEEAVIHLLESTYTKAQKDIEKKAKALQKQIDQLEAMYDLIEDDEAKEKILSMQRSKVYQKKYQDSLKSQVSDILDTMHEEGFETVSEYLTQCYEEGFLGTMYDLHGQNIPLVLPIDQEAIVRAVQLDSNISQGLYKRIGEDVAVLKKNIAAEISRGISTGASFSQIALQIKAKMTGIYDKKTGGALYRAETIAITEGHRIQIQSAMDANYKAKEKGADVVKQWDSTLDGNTRPSHRKVDGEIRELDEPFSNGLMFPGDPAGKAKEVIRCRCALLQRARWALDEDELETLKERAKYFGLDKADSFADFKKKYLKAVEGLETLKLSFPEDVFKIKGFTESVKKEVDRAMKKINNEYEIRLNSIVVEPADKGDIFVTGYHDGVIDMIVNENADFDRIIKNIGRKYNDGYYAGKSLEDYLAHEMAHCMLYQDCISDAMFKAKYQQIEGLYGQLKGISKYADKTQSGNEALAEAFVRVRNNEEVSPIVKTLVNAYFGKWEK